MGQMQNPWGELGLPRGATKLEVKEAYMKLVQQYHPDKHMSASGEQRARAEAKFKNVQEAYALLTSKDRVQVCGPCVLDPLFASICVLNRPRRQRNGSPGDKRCMCIASMRTSSALPSLSAR